MSGHSKWAQIKRQKGSLDVKRGQAFTKLSNAITIAVRGGGGGDPDQNPRLRLMVEKAKAENMPKERILRAIERGLGKGDEGGSELQEVSYEALGPGRTAFIIEVATDNKQRSFSQIKNIISKNGGGIVNTGSVSYQFETAGRIIVRLNNQTFDEVFLLVSQSNAQDLEPIGNGKIAVYTKPEELGSVKDSLGNKLYIESSEIIKKPSAAVNLQDKSIYNKVLSIKSELEGLDDVQKVYTNLV